MTSGLEASEHLKCQTWVLKVSIHCEGCKKRVKKVLQRVEGSASRAHGVYKTTIDCKQQKVIVTGNVAVDTLVKKLFKIGKHAELWPEIRPAAENTISATAAEEKKNKKGSNLDMPSGNPEKSSKKDDTSATEKKAELQEDFTGDDGDKICCNVGGKMKGNMSSTNSGAASIGEAEYIEGVRGILPIQQRPNACHFPAYTSQPPAYLVNYTTSPAPLSCYGGTHYRLPTQQSSFPSYSGHLPLTGPYHIPVTVSSSVSYDLFGEETTDVCSVM